LDGIAQETLGEYTTRLEIVLVVVLVRGRLKVTYGFLVALPPLESVHFCMQGRTRVCALVAGGSEP